ncbi:MAG: L-threonine 3-dehydrogenase [Gammaproteobacteria bacterium]|uniref:L-threonine 3-dehydrogenase n=1 Tax=Candidatus Thiopontia autotrophica TaxID=2841688 RepID=A0A8J6TNU1_9GAMM|nr:L-threonine 3-dehydrogenase [Candidatus Thiopontia autotrophica]MBL6969586.1 L-threonine 3-dehydrogenase [Gammaproteobacteria bacterium]
MKALVKSHARQGIWMEEVAEPEIGPNDALVRITKSAICGTDIHIYNWDEWAQKTIPVPMTVGHEFAGVIEATGSEVRGFKPGDRVSGEGHITCGKCRQCLTGRRHLCPNTRGIGVNREGAFAELLSIPAENLFPLSDAVSDEIASILDPLGNAVHTALSFPVVGEDVLVTGAGPIGIMGAAICLHAGARNVVLTDINPYRLGLAAEVDPDIRTVNIEDESIDDVMSSLNINNGFGVGLEMSGSPNAFSSMLKTLAHGGKMALLGIPPSNTCIDWNLVIFKMITIKGIYGREIFDTWYQMTAMLESGLNVQPLITHRFPIDDYQKGFDVMRSGESGKVILEW